MSANVIAFPASRVPSRAAIETTIERLIELLDAADLATMDCEPDVGEANDDEEMESWPEWHTRSNVLQLRPGRKNRRGRHPREQGPAPPSR